MGSELKLLIFLTMFFLVSQPRYMASAQSKVCHQEDLLKCTAGLKNPLEGDVQNLKQECLMLKNLSTCISNVAVNCENLTLTAKATSDTYDAFCVNNTGMGQKLEKLEDCVKKNMLSFLPCVEPITVNITDPNFKDEVCYSIKKIVGCAPNKAGDVCGSDGKQVMEKLVGIWQPVIKQQCGSGNSLVSLFSLIFASLIALFLYSPGA